MLLRSDFSDCSLRPHLFINHLNRFMKLFSLIILSSALGITSSPLCAQKQSSNAADNNHAVNIFI